MLAEMVEGAGPAVEPLGLTAAKAHLRVVADDEDALIVAMAAAARGVVEDFLRQRLIAQTWRLTLHGFPRAVVLPFWPVISVVQVAYDDPEGGAQVLATDKWRLLRERPMRIVPVEGETWPEVRRDGNAVRVDVRTGYGDGPGHVPPAIMAAMKLTLGSLYENREDVMAGSASRLPLSAQSLLMPHVFWPPE